ncbi:MAG: ribonuclease P protein component [Verrucomicrobiota bacterium]|nr:MAG: ribonuclease P protein component [Verrucomicrobiota bacterium]
MRFRACQHIRRQADFERLRSEGVLKNAPGFFVKTKRNLEQKFPRFAVIVGKKVGAAHGRNRIKRLFRAIFRLEQSRLDPHSDYLVIVRRGIHVSYEKLQRQFLTLCASHHFLTIAIDGAAASGKSTVACSLAKRLRLMNVNTGEQYRSVVCYLKTQGIEDPDDPRIAEIINCLHFGVQCDLISAHITINKKIFPEAVLRSAWVNEHISRFAKQPLLREKLKAYQQSLIQEARARCFAGIVMEGRDIGSVIMPDASIKIFLTADPAIRAQRRNQEAEGDSVQKRDEADQFTAAPDAIVIDTSHKMLEEVQNQILELLHPSLGNEKVKA